VTEYTLVTWRADKNGRLTFKHQYVFTLTPVFKVLRFEGVLPDGTIETKKQLVGKEKELVEHNLRFWFFKKTTTPFEIDDTGHLIWDVRPSFSDEDKDKIKRMYLFEEL